MNLVDQFDLEIYHELHYSKSNINIFFKISKKIKKILRDRNIFTIYKQAIYALINSK